MLKNIVNPQRDNAGFDMSKVDIIGLWPNALTEEKTFL